MAIVWGGQRLNKPMQITKTRIFSVLFIALLTSSFLIIWTRDNTHNSNTKKQSVPAKTATTLQNPSMILGNKNAPVTMVEYADFLCPYCAKYSNEVEPQVKQNYIDTGKVKFEFRPIAYIASDSARAAEGGYCAADQNKFWQYHDYVYKTTWQDYYSKATPPEQIPIFKQANIKAVAVAAGLDGNAFLSCIDSGRHKAEVAKLTADAQSKGISGTPHFLINSQSFTGFAPYSVVKTTIDSFL